MDILKGIYEELFYMGLDILQVREILEANEGYKLSRLNIYDYQTEYLKKWCEKNDLYYRVSDFYVEENILDEGKGRWSNTGKKNDNSGIRFFYIDKDENKVIKAKNIESYDCNEVEKHKTMGELLKIPSCCQNFYLENRNMAENNYFDEYAPLILKNSINILKADWKSNYLAQYFGYSLIHYYPCSFNCSETVRRANDIYQLIENKSTVMAKIFKENMIGLIIVEESKYIIFIKGEIKEDNYYYRGGDIKFTNYTKFVDFLKNNLSNSFNMKMAREKYNLQYVNFE